LPYPTIYNVTYSYTNFQQAQGNNAFPGTQIDSDLQGLRSSVSGLALFVQGVLRSDGALNNGSVTYDSLSPALQTAGVAPANAWATATSYLIGNSVVINGNLYRCLISHTSGVFATDLSAAKWVFVAALQAGTFTQAGTGAVARSVTGKIGETFSVTDFGALGTANDTAVFQAAANALAAAGGGTLLAPPGTFAVRGLTLPGGIILRGAGKSATTLQSWYTDATVLTMSGLRGGLENLTIFGKGVNNDTGALGAVNPALAVGGVENIIRNVLAWGGNYALYVTGTDNSFYDVNAQESYGPANVATIGANWYIRCKFDHAPVAGITDTLPFANWAAATAYTAGQVRITGGYALACTGSGTSAAAAPTVKNYGVNIADGTVTWQLLAPSTYNAVLLGTGAAENHFYQCDFSGAGYSGSVLCQATGTPAVSDFTDCIFSAPLVISNGTLTTIRGCELAGNITINGGYTGKTIIEGNSTVGGGAVNILVGANVNDFIIADNFLNGGTITVTAGTSSRYRIHGNPNCTISDGGTGSDKLVIGSTIPGSILTANSVGNAQLRQGNQFSVIGNSTGSPANVADISAGVPDQILRVNSAGSSLGFGAINLANSVAVGTSVLPVANGGTGAATLGGANGVATLDGGGKLTSSQIPASLIGAVVYQGTWNATTNAPALASGVGTKGWYYKVATAGATAIDGISQWNIGDTIIFDGTTWDKIDGLSSEVITVAGRFGNVVLAVADVSGAAPSANASFTGTFGLSSATIVNWNADTFLGRAAAANIKYGAADAAAPVAQTISAQNVVAGTSNTAGANLTIAGSQGTGTGVGGSILLQTARAGTTGTAQNALTTGFTLDGNTGLASVNTTPDSSTRFTIEDGTGNNQLKLRYTGKTGVAFNQLANGNFQFNLQDAGNFQIFTNNGSGAELSLYGTGGVSVGTTPVDLGANNLYVQGAIGSRIARTLEGSVAVANGLNSNIAASNSFVRLTGPSAVFSAGGFTGGVDGYELEIYNTVAFAMTIVNEDASSTAGNRIKTLTGANVTLRAGTSAARFKYDATDTRWVLLATN
jgi:hypothetical protein